MAPSVSFDGLSWLPAPAPRPAPATGAGYGAPDLLRWPPLGLQGDDQQANDQYIAALYQHNVAKLELSRALGVATTNYKSYLGGK